MSVHPKPGERLQTPIVQLYRHVHDDFAARSAQYLPQAFVELELPAARSDRATCASQGLTSSRYAVVLMRVLYAGTRDTSFYKSALQTWSKPYKNTTVEAGHSVRIRL